MEKWSEENDLILEKIFYQMCKKLNNNSNKLYQIEFDITGECNQKCEYCYLTKYRDKIYPKNISDHKTILNNLNLFLNYLIKNKIWFQKLSLFSGEIWHLSFGYQILEELLIYYKNTYISNKLEDKRIIIIPSNFSFLLQEKATQKIEYFLYEFQKINVRLVFSCSVDGPLLDLINRPLNNDSKIKNSDNFYEKIFHFCKKHGFGYHPMVNAYSIEKWPDQYKWWVDKILQYEQDINRDIMFLEVRNDEWTDDKIEKFLFYMNEGMNYLYDKYYHKDKKEFLNNVLPTEPSLYNNYKNFSLTSQGKNFNCPITYTIHIRLGDLAWIMCHRTSYDIFNYGYFKIKNNKIHGITANNITLPMIIYNTGFKSHPKCDVCPIGELCPRGCFGAQYEANKELFLPCKTVCHLYTAKTLFLYYKIKTFIDNNTEQEKKYILDYYYNNFISKINLEDRNKWKLIIKQLIQN